MTKTRKRETPTAVDRIGDAVDAAVTVVAGYLNQRYKIEKRVEHIKEEAEAKIGGLRDEAIHSAYEVKKGVFRAVVELVLLSTGILALIVGVVVLLSRSIPIEYVLVGYGIIVSIFVLMRMKVGT